MRPTTSETIMKMTWTLSERGSCSRLQVGCIIADHRGISRSSGYNGPPSGMPHCTHELLDEPCLRSLHAEQNAILWAAREGVSVEGCHLYVSHEPCYECAKFIIQAGIKQVSYDQSYPRNSGLLLLEKAGIEVTNLKVK